MLQPIEQNRYPHFQQSNSRRCIWRYTTRCLIRSLNIIHNPKRMHTHGSMYRDGKVTAFTANPPAALSATRAPVTHAVAAAKTMVACYELRYQSLRCAATQPILHSTLRQSINPTSLFYLAASCAPPRRSLSLPYASIPPLRPLCEHLRTLHLCGRDSLKGPTTLDWLTLACLHAVGRKL